MRRAEAQRLAAAVTGNTDDADSNTHAAIIRVVVVLARGVPLTEGSRPE
jgi:hypothetical protein